MEKLTKQQYTFLEHILSGQVKREKLTQDQMEGIMNDYEKSEGLSFVRIILSIGAILIGLGILSFIASNWALMSNVIKLIIIIVFLGSAIFAAYQTEKSYPKTSKALLYLSVLIYGAGIFLIGQMFHLGGSLSDAFLLWSAGTVAASFIQSDRVLAVAAHFLAFVFVLTGFEQNLILVGSIAVVVFYGMNRYFNHLSLITFFNNAYALLFLIYLLNRVDLPGVYIAGIYFLIGLGMFYIKHSLNTQIFKLQGSLIIGISGLILTMQSIWEEVMSIENAQVIAIAFGICFIIYLLSLVKKQLLIPLIFTCGVIMRYYFDVLYDFLPKSLFFIIGGMILLGFGIYFEKIRKQERSQ